MMHSMIRADAVRQGLLSQLYMAGLVGPIPSPQRPKCCDSLLEIMSSAMLSFHCICKIPRQGETLSQAVEIMWRQKDHLEAIRRSPVAVIS